LNKAVDIVVVCKANPEWLQTVLGLLRKEGFNPTTLEDLSGAVALSGCGKVTYPISVAVPAEEVSGATSVLRKWEQAQMPIVLGILLEAVALLFLTWIVVFALLANAGTIMLETEKDTEMITPEDRTEGRQRWSAS